MVWTMWCSFAYPCLFEHHSLPTQRYNREGLYGETPPPPPRTLLQRRSPYLTRNALMSASSASPGLIPNVASMYILRHL